MAYVAVKGGENAIKQSLNLVTYNRINFNELLEVRAIMTGMRSMIDQLMSESSLYNLLLAALAIKQAEGSMEEAVFLLRAHRSTLMRTYTTRTVESEKMFVERRISASFKDIPGGQMLGASIDYSHRLLNFQLLEETKESMKQWLEEFLTGQTIISKQSELSAFPKVVHYLRQQQLFSERAKDDREPFDVTKKSVVFPVPRSARLQVLTRGQTGAVTALGYAAIRGYGAIHPTVGELRVGNLPLTIQHPLVLNDEEEDDLYIGQIKVTEVESFIPVSRKTNKVDELQFEIGYGICFGQNETKAIAMSILDQALEHGGKQHPTHDEEFVLLHIDSVEASGFISHLKLPHYVTFQSKLDSIRKLK